jgi:hypothetical protein
VATLCRIPGKAQRGKGGDMLEEAASKRQHRVASRGQARPGVSGEVEAPRVTHEGGDFMSRP